MLTRHEPRREGKTAGDGLGKSPDLGSGADARAGDGTAVNGGAARRAGRPAGRQWGVVAADDDGLRVGAVLGAGGLCVAVAREVVVELAQGRGAVFYGRVVDGDRFALGGGRHEAGAGRRRVGLLEGEERGGGCHGHDAGEQTWRAVELEAEAVREAEAAIEIQAEVESQIGSPVEVEIESESQIERQGQRWAKTWWIERRRKGG